MRAGILNEIVTILTPKITVNEVGELTTEYVDNFTTRANVTFNNGQRNIENTEIVYNYTKTFKVRYYVKVGEFDRIKWNNKQYRILSIEPNKQYQEITIITELVND